MKKIIDVCTRVEGHGLVNIFLTNQNEDISHVNFELEIYRGFERILLKKELIDLPRISSRICGLCHTVQNIASCKAIENIYGIEPSELSIILRRLMMAGELIKSHSMYLFFQSFPDLLYIFNHWNQNKSPYDLINYNPQLTTSFYDLIKIGNDIGKIFGGRAVHTISSIPGGVIYNPSKKNITFAKKYFQKALTNLDWLIEKYVELFSNKEPPEEYNLEDPTYFSLHNNGNYDRYSGTPSFRKKNDQFLEFLIQDHNKYFDKDIDLRGINFHNEENVLVGPLARKHIIENYGNETVSNYLDYFDKSWYNNMLSSNVIRLFEMYAEAAKSLELLNNPAINNKETLPPLNEIKNFDGFGIVEAPRGTLIHHYHLNKEHSVDQIKLYVATEINLPLINKMITQYAQKLYEKHDINFVKKEIQKIIRSFDPCIACATH